MAAYQPEEYWSRVAQEIADRGENYIAGNDDPFYRYKRRKFIGRFLESMPVDSKIVLECGFGPGGNLRSLALTRKAAELRGVEISQRMLELATTNLARFRNDIELTKTDGVNIPYPDRSVDLSFTVTVLQHNTDALMLRKIVLELCRVTRSTVIIMEDIGKTEAGSRVNGNWVGRQRCVYESLFAESGFGLTSCEFLNTRVSRAWHDLVTSRWKRYIKRWHLQGQPTPRPVQVAIGILLPITCVLDEILRDKEDLAKMVFQRR